jgi:phosphomannomutase
MAQKERLMSALAANPPQSLAGIEILSANCTDGCKLYLSGGWVMFRSSGTEPIVRIYAEADRKERLADILTKAVNYAKNA